MPVIGVRLAEGRSGSTLLMQLLATAPDIAFDRAHPAERRFLSYLVVTAARMTEPWDEARDPGGTAMFFGPDAVWGPVPFASDILDVGSLRRPLLRAMWSAWTAAATASDPAARAYAEKLAVPVEPIVEVGHPGEGHRPPP